MSVKKQNPKGSMRAVSKPRGSALPETKKKSGRGASGLIDWQANEEKQLLMSIRQIVKSHSGPLPSPEDFKKYGEVLPDAPERIMAMAEEEQQIRKDGQTRMLINDEKSMNRATLVGMGFIGVLVLATWLGSVPLALLSILPFILRLLYGLLRQKTAATPSRSPAKPAPHFPAAAPAELPA